MHRIAEVARQTDHRVAGDAGEDRRTHRRRVQHALAHHEDILAAAFAEHAVGAQRDALVVAVAVRLHRHQLAVEVVAAGLGHHREGVGRGALPGRHADVDAALEALRAQHRAPFDGDHRYLHRHVGRRHHAEAARAAEHDRAQVGALGQPVGADREVAGLQQGRAVEGRCHAVDARRLEQPIDVVVQAEDRRALRRGVGADALEHGRAVVQRVAGDVGGGRMPRHEPAVVPDPRGGLHRHDRRSAPIALRSRSSSPDRPAPACPG